MSMLQMCRKFEFEFNCHSGPKTTKYNIEHQNWYNIHTTLPEYCLNIGHQRWGVTLLQCSANVAWTLSHCQSPTLQSDIATTVHTTSTECCLNVSPQCWGATLPQHSYIIGTSIVQCWYTLLTTWSTLANIGMLVEVQYLCKSSHNIVWMSTQHCWDNNKYLQMNIASSLSLTLRQRWHQRCHSVVIGSIAELIWPPLRHRRLWWPRWHALPWWCYWYCPSKRKYNNNNIVTSKQTYL